MKEFDLKAAQNGAAICTRDGRRVEFIYPIIPAENGIIYTNVYSPEGKKMFVTYMNNGRHGILIDSPLDLMMAEEGDLATMQPEMTAEPAKKISDECLDALREIRDNCVLRSFISDMDNLTDIVIGYMGMKGLSAEEAYNTLYEIRRIRRLFEDLIIPDNE